MALRIEHEVLLQVKHIQLTLGQKLILRDINLEIKNLQNYGQIVALLGPSGRGKTQLFRVLSGLQKPDSGEVLLTENSVPVKAGLVGVVSQESNLFQFRSVLSNLVVAGIMAGLVKKDAKEKAEQYLSKVNMMEHATKFPSQLSGGQRQRISILQQLLCSEHFLLMDEPLSGLDPIMNDKVCELITTTANESDKNTVIITTHDIRSAIKVADRIILLGFDYDNGTPIPGATIKSTWFDMIERDLAWHPHVTELPQFEHTYREIKERFKEL